MVNIRRGEVWWADLGEPMGSAPGFRRPVIIVQGDAINRSKISTVICVPLTSNLLWAEAPGNVLLTSDQTGLTKDSVANVSQIVTIDKSLLTEQAGKIPESKIDLILRGIDIILGRS
jgi:mRNA interferase MazF